MPPTAAPALELTGTVTECTAGPAPTCEKVVYQRTTPGAGNIPGDPTRTKQRRRWVQPADPRTPAQLANRAQMAAAVAAWQAMTIEQRAAWKSEGDRRQIGNYCAFISNYLKE